MGWKVEIKFTEEGKKNEGGKDERIVKFNSRPAITEGFNLTRIAGEIEGEIWFNTNEVQRIRVTPEETSSTL